MEERERPRERVSEGDGEESWFEGANGDSEGYLKLGPASLGPLIKGLVFCSKDMRTGHWEKRWQENGRFFSLERGENKGDVSLSWGLDREKKRFNIFVPRGRGAKGGWSLLVEALRGKAEPQHRRRGARVRVDNSALCVNLEKLAHCLVGCWNSTRGRGEDLRSWGTQMSKLWGLKGNLGLAKLENGKALLEFGLLSEAEKALDMAEISVELRHSTGEMEPKSGC
ncbi:hypothetical protein CK203_090920 [Vitis vinifera]|uniref:DUF4283 domain-containing protein n=1 Tax=Vitis vinifera TaxID=29760 RepID=A0A438DRZ8_VITVI|nr:hypothetical protein CK203_090920 [Vitis vinifera]